MEFDCIGSWSLPLFLHCNRHLTAKPLFIYFSRFLPESISYLSVKLIKSSNGADLYLSVSVNYIF